MDMQVPLLQYIMAIVAKRNMSIAWCNKKIDEIKFYKRFGLSETFEEYTK